MLNGSAVQPEIEWKNFIQFSFARRHQNKNKIYGLLGLLRFCAL